MMMSAPWQAIARPSCPTFRPSNQIRTAYAGNASSRLERGGRGAHDLRRGPGRIRKTTLPADWLAASRPCLVRLDRGLGLPGFPPPRGRGGPRPGPGRAAFRR
ncbi:MAG: hypothetical protein M0C28_24490 [Candidatus Moduliflexus flocculans]|nr:hypothetical protein [Candidatus Moduliflexus flocculans]